MLLKRLFLILGCMSLLICSGCQKQEPKLPELDSDGEPSNHAQVLLLDFKNMEEGWIYKFQIGIRKEDGFSKQIEGNYDIGKDTYIAFDGFNLKYKTVDGSGVPVIDHETGEEISRGSITVPSLSTTDGTRNEIHNINQYFNHKKFTKDITVEDLEDLELQVFDKDLLVEMYNKALHNEPDSYGNFSSLPTVALLKSPVDEHEVWQGGYVLGYGAVKACNFEMIVDGVYVSDVVSDGSASEEQKQLQENIQQLEEAIIATQNFTIEGITWKYPEVMNAQRIAAINDILKNLYTGNQFGVTQ